MKIYYRYVIGHVLHSYFTNMKWGYSNPAQCFHELHPRSLTAQAPENGPFWLTNPVLTLYVYIICKDCMQYIIVISKCYRYVVIIHFCSKNKGTPIHINRSSYIFNTLEITFKNLSMPLSSLKLKFPPLKMDDWKTTFPFGFRPIFRGKLAVSFRECILLIGPNASTPTNPNHTWLFWM